MKTVVLSEDSAFDLQKRIESYERQGYSAINPMQVQVIPDPHSAFGSKQTIYHITMQKQTK